MKILSIYAGHDSSATILEDGKIVYYKVSERVSRIKHSSICEEFFQDISLYFDDIFDSVIISFLNYNYIEDVKLLIDKLTNKDTDIKFKKLETISSHHILHAYCAFYNSGFDESIVIVLDGSGSIDDELTKKMNNQCAEIESAYFFKKEDNYLIKKSYFQRDGDNPLWSPFVDEPKVIKEKEIENITITNRLSVGFMFEKCCAEVGWEWYDGGKAMGLSQYKGNEKYLSNKWRKHVEKCFNVQEKTEKISINFIQKVLSTHNSKNVIITGGYGLNCVANCKYLDYFPEINFYIDPICFDSGISIGAAYYEYKKINSKNNIFPLKNVYICGQDPDYTAPKNINTEIVSDQKIVDLLISKNIVAIFQGKSEAGQRALGNRSLLFDPRVKNGKDIVNQIKKREDFRPFGASMLLEYMNEWFEIKNINFKESPYMQYALKLNKKYTNIVPAISHINGTCRVQTVTEKQNYHLYNLIKVFFEATGVPILLNTSFNLGGEPLVETFEDALRTFQNSKIKYLYLPEIKTLLTKKTNKWSILDAYF